MKRCKETTTRTIYGRFVPQCGPCEWADKETSTVTAATNAFLEHMAAVAARKLAIS